MPRLFHVLRNPDGAIVSAALAKQADADTLLETEPELARFLGQAQASSFGDSDAEFVRVLEDLIDTLIQKNLLHHTDLPEAAQRKLVQRRGLRHALQGALNPLVDDAGIL